MCNFVLHLYFQGMAASRRKLDVSGDHPCDKIRFIFALCHEHLPKSCEPMLTLLTQR